jgi:hypothetical protein
MRSAPARTAISVIVAAFLLTALNCCIGIERAEFGGEHIAARHIGANAVAGGAHHIGEHIRRAQHRLQDVARRHKPSRTQVIEG